MEGGVREREVEDRLGKSGGRGRLNTLLQQNQIKTDKVHECRVQCQRRTKLKTKKERGKTKYMNVEYNFNEGQR